MTLKQIIIVRMFKENLSKFEIHLETVSSTLYKDNTISFNVDIL